MKSLEVQRLTQNPMFIKLSPTNTISLSSSNIFNNNTNNHGILSSQVCVILRQFCRSIWIGLKLLVEAVFFFLRSFVPTSFLSTSTRGQINEEYVYDTNGTNNDDDGPMIPMTVQGK